MIRTKPIVLLAIVAVALPVKARPAKATLVRPSEAT